MGLRGPPPTPRRVLELRGSPRAGLHPDAPSPESKRPRPPDWLEGEARKLYLSLTKLLYAMRVMAVIDQHALARYAANSVLWREARDFVAKHGTTYAVRGRPPYGQELGPVTGFKLYPQVKLALSLEEHLLRLEREFGLTPAARARLSTGVSFLEDDGKSAYFAAG